MTPPSARLWQMGHHQLTVRQNLQPTLIAQQAQNPCHGDAGGAEGTGQILVGETQIELQPLVTGLAIIFRQEFQKTTNPIFNPTQSLQGDQAFRLTHQAGHGPYQSHSQVW